MRKNREFLAFCIRVIREKDTTFWFAEHTEIVLISVSVIVASWETDVNQP